MRNLSEDSLIIHDLHYSFVEIKFKSEVSHVKICLLAAGLVDSASLFSNLTLFRRSIVKKSKRQTEEDKKFLITITKVTQRRHS